MPRLQIRRIAHALGAEVRGVDLKSPLDAATITQIRSAWLEHLLLCFPEQDLDRDELLTFARRFGDLEPAGINVDPDRPAITMLSHKPLNGRPWDGYKNGHNWHADQSYTTRPTVGIFISCKEVPPAGGDTMFANMYMAYETLSPGMQHCVDQLSAIHFRQLPLRAVFQGSNDGESVALRTQRLENERSSQSTPTVHPAVRVHPETNRKALFLGPRVRQFCGMTEDESRPFLDFLDAHAVSYELTYRHRWTPGDLVMWDNRCLLHLALSDYDMQRDSRHMIRCAITGGMSGYHYVAESNEPTALSARA